jgi:phosphoglycerol transferase MdoB-like AlkP superfamily enzyme
MEPDILRHRVWKLVRRPLGRRDWTYLLALLLPFALYNLTLKASRVASLPDEHGLLGVLKLMRSDLLFNAGYILLWIGLFMVARRGLLRLGVVALFHVTTLLVLLVATGAHGFYEVTGFMLDSGTIFFFLSSPAEIGAIVASEVTLALIIVVSTVLLYAVFGPWLVVRLMDRWRGWSPASASERLSWPGVPTALLVASLLLSFSLLPGGGPAGASTNFARDAFVNVAMTEFEDLMDWDESPYANVSAVRDELPTETSLAPTEQTRKRNVVLISLESTRARSVTPYNEDIETTPYLDELAEDSLFAERAYAPVPHTTNALVASICGIDPPNRRGTYFVGNNIPAQCLPDLLNDQGYNSVYFTSSVETFERRPEVVDNMGYEEFYPVETMETEGFEKANYFGYEDDVMLEPSKQWLEKNGDEPFIATYETITPHHQYLAPDNRYGSKDFAEDDELNRYQNSVRYLDFFVKNLVDQYKEAGLYENTVFVIYGDHGEAFGEHGRSQHDNVMWEEGVRIPLMVVDPARPEGGRIEKPVNQLDILPTVVDLLGYEVAGGEYPGYSLLNPPAERTLMFSCWYEDKCLASLKGDRKYIYNYGNEPDEFYDLSEDPLEKNNIVDQIPQEELEKRREALLEWRAKADVVYGP